uniref:Signal peptide peptidase like 2B n=1 Tax=Piliocolobus tephrosceles TaxID=591936 RepID=A0A8C9I0H9_9PRIM
MTSLVRGPGRVGRGVEMQPALGEGGWRAGLAPGLTALPLQCTWSSGSSAWPPPPACTAAWRPVCGGYPSASAGEAASLAPTCLTLCSDDRGPFAAPEPPMVQCSSESTAGTSSALACGSKAQEQGRVQASYQQRLPAARHQAGGGRVLLSPGTLPQVADWPGRGKAPGFSREPRRFPTAQSLAWLLGVKGAARGVSSKIRPGSGKQSSPRGDLFGLLSLGEEVGSLEQAGPRVRGAAQARGLCGCSQWPPSTCLGQALPRPWGAYCCHCAGMWSFIRRTECGLPLWRGVPGQGPRVVGSGMRPGAGGLGSDCPMPPRIPNNSLPYFHKRPQARMLLLALFCVAVSVVWGVFRNEDQWAWVLQDALGIAFCLYMLKTIRLPTFKACTLLLLVLFLYDIFFVFITPFLTKSGSSIMVEVATGPSDSATREKLPMVLKVPRLNSSPLALCDRPFSLLGFGDILVPGLLVAYCHRFDIQVQSSRVYFVACTIAYGVGLLVTFVALALMQRGQPALLYLVPCTLVTSCAVALWRRELGVFWTGSGFAKVLPPSPWAPAPADSPQPPKDSATPLSPQPPSKEPATSPQPAEQSPEPCMPEEMGAGAPTREPGSPAEPEGQDQDQAQPCPVAQPGALA